jgi:hypothetical protein
MSLILYYERRFKIAARGPHQQAWPQIDKHLETLSGQKFGPIRQLGTVGPKTTSIGIAGAHLCHSEHSEEEVRHAIQQLLLRGPVLAFTTCRVDQDDYRESTSPK